MPRARIEAYLDRLYGYALSLSKDQDRAQDLVQQCALKALRAYRVPRDEAAFRAWLFKILRHAFLDDAKSHDKKHEPLDYEAAHEVGLDWHVEERLVSQITIRLAIEDLSEAHRDVIALIDITGLSY